MLFLTRQPSGRQEGSKQTAGTNPQGKSCRRKVTTECEENEQNEGRRDNVTCENTVGKCRSELWANALKQEQLPKTRVTRGVEIRPD